MDKLNSETLDGKAVKIILKNGKTCIGYLPIQSTNQQFENSSIAFLPYSKSFEFYSFFKGKTTLTNEDLKKFLKYYKRDEINSYMVLENEVSAIRIENGKPPPNWLKVRVNGNPKPGHVNVKYKIPENNKWFDLGDLQILNSAITLPLTLVFLSYAKADKKIVIDIMKELHENGILTWLDEKDLLPGDNWEAKIEEAIEKSDYVLVFLSSKSIDTIGFKNKEVKYALDQYSLRPSGRRYIIPILLDEVIPPRDLKKIHWLKVTEEKWFDKLLMALGKYSKK